VQHREAADRVEGVVRVAHLGRWRSLLRLEAALPALAAGEPVGNVARRVGYESASAFVAAFRRETGVTPAAYFRATLVRPGGPGGTG